MIQKYLKKELIGTLNTVIFCPEDLQAHQGGTLSGRRRFRYGNPRPVLYTIISLMQYNRLLQQRNAILKEYRGKKLFLLKNGIYN